MRRLSPAAHPAAPGARFVHRDVSVHRSANCRLFEANSKMNGTF
jgi:hypothetical protein